MYVLFTIQNVEKGKYKVVINSKIKKGSMTYADLLIKGKSKKEIFYLTYNYICHPSMANNEFLCLLTFIAKSIVKLKIEIIVIELFFHPENIGKLIIYLKI